MSIVQAADVRADLGAQQTRRWGRPDRLELPTF
jgi:hypothetical protein